MKALVRLRSLECTLSSDAAKLNNACYGIFKHDCCSFNGFKGSIFLKIRHFIVQEIFNKLIYCINTIIKCDTRQPVELQLVSRSWNDMIFCHISELMLPTLIQRYDKKKKKIILLFHFDIVQNRETNWNFTDYQDCINATYQFNKPFLDNKMSTFEEYGAFNAYLIVLPGRFSFSFFFFFFFFFFFLKMETTSATSKKEKNNNNN